MSEGTNNGEPSQKLIDDHWTYVKDLLEAHELLKSREPYMIKAIEFHYKTAFTHGWKHARELRDRCEEKNS